MTILHYFFSGNQLVGTTDDGVTKVGYTLPGIIKQFDQSPEHSGENHVTHTQAEGSRAPMSITARRYY